MAVSTPAGKRRADNNLILLLVDAIHTVLTRRVGKCPAYIDIICLVSQIPNLAE